jgi:hypothetical protein
MLTYAAAASAPHASNCPGLVQYKHVSEKGTAAFSEEGAQFTCFFTNTKVLALLVQKYKY